MSKEHRKRGKEYQRAGSRKMLPGKGEVTEERS